MGELRWSDLNEQDEIRRYTYHNAQILKEKAKAFHDKHILRREFAPGQKVLLYNPKLYICPRKLRSKWYEPFEVVQVFPYGTIEILNHCKVKG